MSEAPSASYRLREHLRKSREAEAAIVPGPYVCWSTALATETHLLSAPLERHPNSGSFRFRHNLQNVKLKW